MRASVRNTMIAIATLGAALATTASAGMAHSNWRVGHSAYAHDMPWWVDAPLTIGSLPLRILTAPFDHDRRYYRHGMSRHVSWCADRYRSYDPASNTWISNSGRERQCVSPYWR